MIEPDKDYIRLLGALDGFRDRHGEWPPRVVVYPKTLERLREFLGEAFFSAIEQKVELLPGPEGFKAEGDGGLFYDYGLEGFPAHRPTPSAQEWLDIPLEQVWNEWLERNSG